jgi:hypothetical protein
MSRQVDRYVEKVQKDIVACPNEQSCEGGEIAAWIFGSPTDIEDLLMTHGVPERIWEDVISRLECPRCGNSIETGQQVGTTPEFEIRHEKQIDNALQRYRGKLLEFTDFLKSYPFLGVAHPIGKRIVKEIRKLPGRTLENRVWFRARKVEGPIPMRVDDLRPPNPGRETIPEGRFSHFGQACWYLSSEAEAAAAEVTSGEERLTWVQEWKVENAQNVLDLRAWYADDDRAVNQEGESLDFPLLRIALIFGDHLSAAPDRKSILKPEYLVPRFVADAARHAGYSGIRFKSVKSFGENLVLFDGQMALVPVGEPKLKQLDESTVKMRDGLFLYQGFPIFDPGIAGL